MQEDNHPTVRLSTTYKCIPALSSYCFELAKASAGHFHRKRAEVPVCVGTVVTVYHKKDPVLLDQW